MAGGKGHSLGSHAPVSPQGSPAIGLATNMVSMSVIT